MHSSLNVYEFTHRERANFSETLMLLIRATSEICSELTFFEIAKSSIHNWLLTTDKFISIKHVYLEPHLFTLVTVKELEIIFIVLYTAHRAVIKIIIVKFLFVIIKKYFLLRKCIKKKLYYISNILFGISQVFFILI